MFTKRGDKVKAIAGKNKNKKGVVLVAFPKKDKVVAEGINVVKKHQKSSQVAPQGGVVETEASIHVSNMTVADSTGAAGRIGYKEVDGKKVRVSRRTDEVLDK